jgi:hypothetical protein
MHYSLMVISLLFHVWFELPWKVVEGRKAWPHRCFFPLNTT